MKLLIVTNTDPLKINHIVDAFVNRNDIEIKVLHQYESKYQANLFDRVCYKLKLPTDPDNLNQRLLENMQNFKPDILFISKGNVIYPWTLKSIRNKHPSLKIISWSLDDMYAWHNRSIYYTLALKYYDIVFTTKSYNLEELKQLGAKKTIFIYQAYSKYYHRPYSDYNKSKNRYEVLFIGAAEKERIESLNYLANNGIKIFIYGGGWNKIDKDKLHQNLVVHEYDLVGSAYADALSCAKVSLCFLRKANRDLHTSRSIEIPACGGFMLAERTEEHLALFEENKEAVYFDNDEELLEKVKYYLGHEEERKIIAENGLMRCETSGYSYDEMVKKILKTINE